MNAVKFLPRGSTHDGQVQVQVLLSGAGDGSIRLWREVADYPGRFSCESVVDAHSGAVNCLASHPDRLFFVSGAADASIKVWRVGARIPRSQVAEIQKITLSPKYFPLALALHPLGENVTILVVGGTRSSIQVFISKDTAHPDFSLKATLTGHEGWIRSLDIISEGDEGRSDLLIASASQDKYIRLWRLHQGTDLPPSADPNDALAGSISRTISSKAQRFDAFNTPYSLTFEALLLGHEDWVYSVKWNRHDRHLRLLSASADSSLAIWEPDKSSGVWIAVTRLGEISIQKGSTTATGSTGGFWTGLWLHGGASVACLGRTGSWRMWQYDAEQDRWAQGLGVAGHVGEARDLAWSKDGSYLLSTSADQTTRLHARWRKSDAKSSWKEFARPQIHGYDLNCVDSISNTQFITGADEKLLRVFDQPRATAQLLQGLSNSSSGTIHQLPEVASIPVLGLSNKAADSAGTDDLAYVDGESTIGHTDSDHHDPPKPANHPPFEDELARHTLWPEREKLYGHGFEISAVAASHDGSLVATACKASSIDHAVIRLYETQTWHEVHPPLKAHSLTVTCLRFSDDDDEFLLSVGRDRQWAVFRRDEADRRVYSIYTSEPKGHSRMVLGAAWAPTAAGSVFATAGRDKQVKLWAAEETGGGRFNCRASLAAAAPVTTVDFHSKVKGGCLCLASGTETGQVTFSVVDASFAVVRSTDLRPELCPALAVTQLTWRPENGAPREREVGETDLLAIASDDCSVRLISLADWSTS